MSNTEHFLKQVYSKLQELKVVLEAGLPVSGTDLTSIATNTATVSACVDTVNHHLEVDTNAINGVTMSVSNGTLDSGTQRVCIADDDANLSGIYAQLINLGGAIWFPDVQSINGNACLLNGNAINLGDGNNGAGCQRVTIARDDYNVKQLMANSSGWIPAFNVNLRGIHFGASDVDISSANGNVDSGTLRVTIADNDTNLANIASNLTTIANILSDVWDSTAHALRTV